MCAQYNLELVVTGSFSDYLSKYKPKSAEDTMDERMKRYSFMNNYFVFKKV